MRAILGSLALAAVGACGMIAAAEEAPGARASPAPTPTTSEPSKGDVTGPIGIEPSRVIFADGSVIETTTEEAHAMSISTVRRTLAPAEEAETGIREQNAGAAPAHSVTQYEMRRIERWIDAGSAAASCNSRRRPTHLMIMRDDEQGVVAVRLLRKGLFGWAGCGWHMGRPARQDRE